MIKRTLTVCLILISGSLAAETARAPSVSASVYKALERSEQLIEQKNYSGAINLLQQSLQRSQADSYERATLFRAISSVYAVQGQYSKSAEMLKKCLALKQLPEDQEQQAILNLGQLYMASGQFAQAIETLQPWLADNPKPDAQLSAMLANAYTQLQRYRQALPLIENAIAATRRPEEAWYQLNLALYFELKKYSSAAQLLKKLLLLYPDNKTYWDQLAATYQHLRQFKQAANIKHLAYTKGLLTSAKDILALSDLFLYIGSPYKAAKLLHQSIQNRKLANNASNWEKLATAWQLAREWEKATDALQAAADKNPKGDLFQRLGQIFVEQEQWRQAADALQKALRKGGLDNPGNVYLLLGISYFELNRLDQAKTAFATAQKYARQRKSAQQWLNFIEENIS